MTGEEFAVFLQVAPLFIPYIVFFFSAVFFSVIIMFIVYVVNSFLSNTIHKCIKCHVALKPLHEDDSRFQMLFGGFYTIFGWFVVFACTFLFEISFIQSMLLYGMSCIAYSFTKEYNKCSCVEQQQQDRINVK